MKNSKKLFVGISIPLLSFFAVTGIILGIGSASRSLIKPDTTDSNEMNLIEVADTSVVGTAPISGTFLDLYYNNLPADKVESYLDEVQGMGMDTIIITATRKRAGTCDNLTFSDESGVSTNQGTPLYNLVESTSRRGMNIYLGLAGFHGCTPLAGLYTNLNAITSIAADVKSTVERFETSFRNFSSLKGYYITDEPIRFWIADEEGTTAANNFNRFYKQYNDAIDNGVSIVNSRNPSTPKTRITLASPTFGGINVLARTPTWTGNWALSFKNFTGIDILAFQDTVGGLGLYTFPSPIGDYYTAIASKIGANSLWVNHELFNYANTRTTIGTRVKQQVNAVRSSDVSKRITWSQHIYMSDIWSGHYLPSTRLRETYLAQFGVRGQVLTPSSYKWLKNPENAYSDAGNELFDAKVGDPRPLNTYGAVDTKWTGLTPSNGSVSLWVDLGSPKNVSWITAQLLRDKNSGVRIPSKIEVQCIGTTGTSSLGTLTMPVSSLYNEPQIVEDNGGDYSMSNLTKFNSTCSNLLLTFYNTDWTFISELEIVSSPN